jgi:hypothetical protein
VSPEQARAELERRADAIARRNAVYIAKLPAEGELRTA